MPELILDSTECRNIVGENVKQLFDNEKSCQVVSAYVSKSDLFDDPNHIESLQLICNARSSSTNPYTLRALLKNAKVELKSRNDIHAKVYIFQDKAVITSANATYNGLGSGTIEAASLIDSEHAIKEVKDWFGLLWNNIDTENVRDFSDKEWKSLEAAWNISNSKSRKTNLIDLINTKTIPNNIIFCFWSQTDNFPSKKKVAAASIEQGIVEVPENWDSWDYWIEGTIDSVDKEEMNKILSKHYSKVCVNIESDSWPPNKIYKKDIFMSRLLDKAVTYNYKNKELLLSLYRTDKVEVPFTVDKKAISLINRSITSNNVGWKKLIKTVSGGLGYCTPNQLYKLLDD